MLGSKRNYGFRYLLPLAPPAIVWVSALAEGGPAVAAGRGVGLGGHGARGRARSTRTSCPTSTPLAGGPIGGRRILADSNLDWGQGAKVARQAPARAGPSSAT